MQLYAFNKTLFSNIIYNACPASRLSGNIVCPLSNGPGWIPGLPEISGPAYRETVSHDAG